VAKLTDKQRVEVIADRVNGMTFRALAKKYGVAVGTIQNVCTDTEVVQKCTHKKEEDVQSVLEFMSTQRDDVISFPN